MKPEKEEKKEEEKELKKESADPEKEKKEELKKPEATSDFDFIREQIRERPIDRKKLVGRFILTAGLAIFFGLVACLTILVLEPLLSRWLSSEEDMELKVVSLPENREEEVQYDEHVQPSEEEEPEQLVIETPLEEMSLSDADVPGAEEDSASDNDAQQTEPQPTPVPETTVVYEQVPLELEDYRQLYRKLYALSQDVTRSLVTITSVPEDVDWSFETAASDYQTVGMVVADNGYELLILADSSRLSAGKEVQVSFSNGKRGVLREKAVDENTHLAIYGIPLSELDEDTKGSATAVILGSSYTSSILGNAVMAVGRPLGSTSICYGAVTSTDRMVNMTDASYQLLSTDIYGSADASGVIVNIRGQVAGFICQSYNEAGMENMIHAYGISSIRKLIEDLSNGHERAYLGLQIGEVLPEAATALSIPRGVYVSRVEMDSPAMGAGISRGDIILQIGESATPSPTDYTKAIEAMKPEEETTVRFARYDGQAYREMEVQLSPGSR
ncbi:MAG: serine protease [Lachnospiraceae bacterium]|nr:serine protease [Lachnospiraceae bacterium]